MPFDATPTDTPASLLIEAAMRRIDKPERWCKLPFPMASGAVCGALAVMQYVKDQDDYRATIGYLHAAAKERGFDRFWDFNDARATTHADVLACMRRAAEIARGW